MLVRSQDTTPFEIPGGTKGALYPDHPTGEMTLARVAIDGVYPESGVSVNAVCTESLYVIEGELALHVDKETHVLRPGDVYMVTPGQAYRCKGKAVVLDVITPAWDKGQNTIHPQEV